MDPNSGILTCPAYPALTYGAHTQASATLGWQEITEAAMRGELDFFGSLKSRVALLKGAEPSMLAHMFASM